MGEGECGGGGWADPVCVQANDDIGAELLTSFQKADVASHWLQVTDSNSGSSIAILGLQQWAKHSMGHYKGTRQQRRAKSRPGAWA